MARTRVQRPILAIMVLALLIVAVVAAALFVGAQRQQPPPLFRNGVIAVAKDGDIFVADRPGGDLRPLVVGPEHDGAPNFSPDGTKLAFLRETEQGSAQMLADADGTNIVQISPEPPELTYGSFAPDGRSLMAVKKIDGEWRVVVRPVDPTPAPTVLEILLDGSSMVRYQSGGPSFNPTNPQEILAVGRLAPDGPRGIYVYDLAMGALRTILEEDADQYVFDVGWLPDGEHITYRSTKSSGDSRVVSADGSGDQDFDGLRGRFDRSPFSNDGTRIVAERGGEGVQAPRPPVIVLINGDGEPVALACGPATDIECPQPPTDWIWSPDDSMLIATVHRDLSGSGEGPLTAIYLLVDAHSGQVTELDWVDVGAPAWQRVAP